MLHKLTFGRLMRVTGALVLAFFLWLSVELNNRFTTVIQVPVNYENIPKNLRSRTPLPSSFRLTVNGKGRDLLFSSYQLNTDTVRLDLSPFIDQPYVMTNRIVNVVSRSLPGNYDIIQITPDTLNLAFEKKVSRRIPVKLAADLKPAEGFKFIRPPRLIPDSVVITGPADSMKNITDWSTKPTLITHLEGSTVHEIQLHSHPEFVFNPTTVKVHSETKRFVEAKVVKKVIILNPFPTQSIRLMPRKTVTVRFLVPFDEYEKVREEDFRVVIDAKKLNTKSAYVRFELEKVPVYASGIRFDPPYSRYVVTQK